MKRMMKMKLTSDLARQLNDQITRERFAEASYLAIGSWADAQAYPGLTAWADKQAAEEREHAKKLIEYVRDRGQVMLQPVPEPVNVFAGYLGALEGALGLEQSVTAALTGIYRSAMGALDGATADLMQSYLAEQVEAERNLEIYTQRAGRAGDDLDLLDAILFEG